MNSEHISTGKSKVSNPGNGKHATRGLPQCSIQSTPLQQCARNHPPSQPCQLFCEAAKSPLCKTHYIFICLEFSLSHKRSQNNWKPVLRSSDDNHHLNKKRTKSQNLNNSKIRNLVTTVSKDCYNFVENK